MQRFTFFLLALASAHCGGSVAAETTPEAAVDPPAPAWAETAACSTIATTCTTDPAVLVRGHASGLAGLDGARVEFAVRYVREEGKGLDVPHGVALGRTTVKGDTFETCVCVPHGANMYPQIAAVVYRPGATSMTSRDVARATFSQRYATLGDEDVGYALNAVPTVLQKEAAVAAMSDRVANVTLSSPGLAEGTQITAGLVADERPVAAQVAHGGVAAGAVELRWTMPGHAWPSERVAFFVDRNKNGRCDTDGSDVGAITPFKGAIAHSGAWLEGAALAPVCDALRPDASRE